MNENCRFHFSQRHFWRWIFLFRNFSAIKVESNNRNRFVEDWLYDFASLNNKNRQVIIKALAGENSKLHKKHTTTIFIPFLLSVMGKNNDTNHKYLFRFTKKISGGNDQLTKAEKHQIRCYTTCDCKDILRSMHTTQTSIKAWSIQRSKFTGEQ